MTKTESSTQQDLRRTRFLHFAGPAWDSNNPDQPGRLYPENAEDLSWYENDSNQSVKKQFRQLAKAFEKICGVRRLKEIKSLYGEEARLQGVTEEDERESKKQMYNRYREAFAQRHRIQVSDLIPSGIDYGITINNTRYNETVTLTVSEVDQLIADSINYAKEVPDYMQNPQTGLLRGLTHILPGSVNEPKDLQNPIDLFLLSKSHKWGNQARFEARRILGLSDLMAEIILYRKKYEGLKDDLFDVLNHHGVFSPEQHGPIDKPVEFITLHNPHNFAVEGIHILDKEDSYKPNPYILYNKIKVRPTIDPDNPQNTFNIQLNDEPKGIIQIALKMIRRNAIDPAEIRDVYRLATTFINRGDIDKFQTAIELASHRAGKPIKVEREENTLDGGRYQALKDGHPQKYAGSSNKYQVMRLKLNFEDKPNEVFELSCYTLEAFVNYALRDNVCIGEYLIKRQIFAPEGKWDASVFEYLYPKDIYGIDALKYENALISGIRVGNRQKAFVPNEWQTKKPIDISEEEIEAATIRIAEQIQPPVTDSTSHAAIQSNNFPQAIISVGPNCFSAGTLLKDIFGIKGSHHINFHGQIENIPQFIANYRDILKNNRLLILDDIGIEGKKVKRLREILEENRLTDTTIAFLGLKPDSPAAEITDYYGREIREDEYLYFPHQLHEHTRLHLGAIGLITRMFDGRWQILVQNEEKFSEKLSGGMFNSQLGDESTLETLRREWIEELGADNALKLINSMEHKFPIIVNVPLDPNASESLANTVTFYGYQIDGSSLNIDNFQLPERSEVKSLHWEDLAKLADTMPWPGYKNLLQELIKRKKTLS
ncbi:hypothetical protein A3E42_00145 [Candidatus Gottesmanbacteria bacterium RIFCSPHIGHO2_12_FULL_40_13]|nr:MAG: hypothetical protein A3E42_00145 [Candidatus Gottesmanbacteria bacterium RIFCSPHIGHO2_12_FULL_40_13]